MILFFFFFLFFFLSQILKRWQWKDFCQIPKYLSRAREPSSSLTSLPHELLLHCLASPCCLKLIMRPLNASILVAARLSWMQCPQHHPLTNLTQLESCQPQAFLTISNTTIQPPSFWVRLVVVVPSVEACSNDDSN